MVHISAGICSFCVLQILVHRFCNDHKAFNKLFYLLIAFKSVNLFAKVEWQTDHTYAKLHHLFEIFAVF